MKAREVGRKYPCYLDAENSPTNRRIIRGNGTSSVKPGGAGCALRSFRPYVESEADDGFRLQALGSLFHFEFNGLAFVEGLVTLGLNGTVVHEDILAALPLNEPVALAGVKPLYCSLFSTQLLTPLNGKLFALVVASRVQKKAARASAPAASSMSQKAVTRATNAAPV